MPSDGCGHLGARTGGIFPYADAYELRREGKGERAFPYASTYGLRNSLRNQDEGSILSYADAYTPYRP